MNNFNQSSTGINLELFCYRDEDLAHMYFNEQLTEVGSYSLLNPRFSGVTLYCYAEGGYFPVIEPHDPQWYKYKKADLIDLLESAAVFTYGGTVNLCDLATEYHGKNYKRLTIDEIFDYLDQEFSNAADLAQLYYEHLTPLFEVVSVRGYSQGDYVEVIIPTSENVSQDYLQNLIYSCPVYCRLSIDGDEYQWDEHCDDQYHYDKDEALVIFDKMIEHKEKAYIIQWLATNLPIHPNYN